MSNVPLKALGLEKAWPKLARLQDEIADLQRQASTAEAEVRRLESALDVARNEDVAAQAQALRGGKAAPKTSREDKVQRELETARRNRDVLQRATQDAHTELGEFRAKHGRALYEDVARARAEIARELSRHAQAAAAAFGKWSDMHYVLKDLTPPPPAVDTENAPAPPLTMSVIGVHTTQSMGGPPRGKVEEMLQYLMGLAPAEEESTDAA